MAGAAAIEVDRLSRTFGRFKAVDEMSFEVRRGEVFGFLGSNGAGKSTTIRMLCGLLRPTSGSASVGGIDVSADPEGVKRRIGYMSQRFSLYELLTVDQNIRLYGNLSALENVMIGRHVRTAASVWGAVTRNRKTLAEEAAIE